MPTPPLAQSAICAPAHGHALFLTFNRQPECSPEHCRLQLGQIALLLDQWASRDPAARNCWAIGIGVLSWASLIGPRQPRLLAGFPQFANAIHPAADTPHDLFLHLRSEKQDWCFEAGQQIESALRGSFTLAGSTAGFRYLDSRDLTGFVDGTENPEPDARPSVALVADDDEFNGGSYLHVQRYVHDLERWRELDVATQEKIIGRTKQDDQELDDDTKPENAHIARVVIEEDGEELEIVRQSMPYGTVGGEKGLYFVSYCKTPATFNRMLERMVCNQQGPADRVLFFSRAVEGGAYFVPPKAMLAGWV